MLRPGYQVLEVADPLLRLAEERVPLLTRMLQAATAEAGAVEIGQPQYRNPVALWANTTTDTGRTDLSPPRRDGSPSMLALGRPSREKMEVDPDSIERIRTLWTASVCVRFDAGDQLLVALRRLRDGLSVDVDEEGAAGGI